MNNQTVFKTTGLEPMTRVALDLLRTQASVSRREAMLDKNIQSLASQVFKLREKGFDVRKKLHRNPVTGTRYARYWLGNNHDPSVIHTPRTWDTEVRGAYDYAM